MTPTINQLVQELSNQLKSRQWTLSVAESCTGGGLGFALTSLPGSSDWFTGGFITYSNVAKQTMLSVNKDTLATFGAVSEQTAREMAEGSCQHCNTDIAVAITGIAGPNGGTAEKPVGTVCFGFASKTQATKTKVFVFTGDRHTIRLHAVEFALDNLLRYLNATVE